jgi:single-stranded DNA-binding protein
MDQKPTNQAVLQGEITRDPKSGQGGNGPWCFFSIRPEGDRSILDCSAFGEAATQIGALGKGSIVRVMGRLGSGKDKKLTEKTGQDIWVMKFVVDVANGGKVAVIKVATAGGEAPPADDLRF